nr:ribonuclease H-like domain-containing protein [Tanacetum cinerariifolium]
YGTSGQAKKETEPVKDYILLPLWDADPLFSQDPKSSNDDGSKPSSDDGKKVDEDLRKENEYNNQEKTPTLSFMRPFGCPVTILNIIDHLGKFNGKADKDHLGKFDGKADEGFFVVYSMNNKAFKVFNSQTKIVEETLHITFLENKPNIVGSELTWLFDIDTLAKSMNYKLVVTGNQSNDSTGKDRMETVPDKDYILLPLWTQYLLLSSSSKNSPSDGFKPSGVEEKKDTEDLENEENKAPITEDPSAASYEVNAVCRKSSIELSDDPNMPDLKGISIFEDPNEDVSIKVDMTNMDTNILVRPIPTTKIHKIKAMQDELLYFKLQQVWTLVDLPYGNSPSPIYDQEPTMVAKDDEMSKDKEIDKLIALISLSFKKIYKPTNNNLRTSSNTSRANQDNSLRINRGTRYDNQRIVNVAGARENVAYHKEKMLLCKQEEAGFQLNAEQADWRDDTDDEPEDQEIEAHYIEHPERSKSVHDTYSIEQDEHNVIIDSLDISYDREQVDQDDDDLANERDLLASLIEKLKCKIDDSQNRNRFLETSNKDLVDKLKGKIEDFKTKNKSLESSNNHFKEANNELSKTNKLMFKDLKKFQAELDRYHDVKYASKVEINCGT